METVGRMQAKNRYGHQSQRLYGSLDVVMEPTGDKGHGRSPTGSLQTAEAKSSGQPAYLPKLLAAEETAYHYLGICDMWGCLRRNNSLDSTKLI